MQKPETILNRQRMALLVVLMTFVTSIYMLTYSARIESTDSLFMFDAAASFVRHGDFLLDMSAGERRFWEYEEPLPEIPLLPVDAEPVQIILASPLYWLADVIPGFGRIHAVWLFNVLITSLAVGLFYLYAIQLHYDDFTAAIGALLFGLGTIVWAYSKTFFQEPLTMLLVMLTAYWVERWRTSHFRNLPMLMLAILTFLFALFARRAVIVTAPVMAIIAFPWFERLYRQKWIKVAVLAGIVGVPIVIYAITVPQSIDALEETLGTAANLSADEKFFRVSFNQGMRTYLFSIGGSIWGTSPVLLLAVPGMVLLWRRNQLRYLLAALTMLMLYSLLYAYASGGDWFGGLSWPPRFLVPTVPFLMLCTLPVIQSLRKRTSPAVVRGIVSTVVLYSLWIQFNAVSYGWDEYAKLLPLEANGFTEWRGGLHNVRYLRWVLLPQLWGTVPFDFVWLRTHTVIYPLLFGGLAVTAGVALYQMLKKPPDNRLALHMLTFAPVVTVFCIAVGLRLIYVDDEYLAFSNGLNNVVPVMNSEFHSDDAMLISELGYERFFMNYGRIQQGRIISLPDHPGEQPSPDEPALIRSPNPADLLENPSVSLVHTLANERKRLWVLSHSAPYIPWSVRPLERYMAAVYFPLRTIDTSEADGLPVVLIEYVTTAHHDPYSLIGAEYPSDLRYSDNISMVGFNLPLDSTYAPGEALPISLYWVAGTAPTANYTVAFHLAQDGGGVVASGEDSQPYAGFAPTSTWLPGQPVWDNRALRIPPDLPAGNYQLWVGLYGFDASGTLQSLEVTSGEAVEQATIGVLPITITVS